MADSKVLIVSDDPEVTQQFRKRLEHLPFTAIVCCTVDELVMQTTEHKPNLIFVKFREIKRKIEALQQIPAKLAVPVVFLPVGKTTRPSELQMVETMVRSLRDVEDKS